MQRYRRLYDIEAEQLTEGRQTHRPSGSSEYGETGDWWCYDPTTGLEWIMKDRHFKVAFTEVNIPGPPPDPTEPPHMGPLTVKEIVRIFDVTPEIAQRMIEHGRESIGQIAACLPADLYMIEGVNAETADELIETAKRWADIPVADAPEE